MAAFLSTTLWRTQRLLKSRVSSSGSGSSTRPYLYVASIPYHPLDYRPEHSYSDHLQNTGALVTSDLIAGYIKASAPGVTKIAGVTSKHASIASNYLQSEVDKAARGEYPSEFLTSDLMGYLDAPSSNSKL